METDLFSVCGGNEQKEEEPWQNMIQDHQRIQDRQRIKDEGYGLY